MVFFRKIFNNECIAVVTNDDIVRQEMAYNRERKHTMKKRAKKLRLRITQRFGSIELDMIRISLFSSRPPTKQKCSTTLSNLNSQSTVKKFAFSVIEDLWILFVAFNDF